MGRDPEPGERAKGEGRGRMVNTGLWRFTRTIKIQCVENGLYLKCSIYLPWLIFVQYMALFVVAS